MHQKSSKKFLKLMSFLVMMTKGLSMILMAALVNSLVWGEEGRGASGATLTQRNCSELSSVIKVLLSAILAKVVVGVQNILTLVLRSTMLT